MTITGVTLPLVGGGELKANFTVFDQGGLKEVAGGPASHRHRYPTPVQSLGLRGRVCLDAWERG